MQNMFKSDEKRQF